MIILYVICIGCDVDVSLIINKDIGLVTHPYYHTHSSLILEQEEVLLFIVSFGIVFPYFNFISFIVIFSGIQFPLGTFIVLSSDFPVLQELSDNVIQLPWLVRYYCEFKFLICYYVEPLLWEVSFSNTEVILNL